MLENIKFICIRCETGRQAWQSLALLPISNCVRTWIIFTCTCTCIQYIINLSHQMTCYQTFTKNCLFDFLFVCLFLLYCFDFFWGRGHTILYSVFLFFFHFWKFKIELCLFYDGTQFLKKLVIFTSFTPVSVCEDPPKMFNVYIVVTSPAFHYYSLNFWTNHNVKYREHFPGMF
jgi:hypothetical protein